MVINRGGQQVVSKNEDIYIPIEGIAIKGGGRSVNFHRPIDVGSIDSHTQFGQPVHEVDVVGGANHEHQTVESETLVNYLEVGARVDVPIMMAKINERQRFKLGILAIGYRTPFNFQQFLNLPNYKYKEQKFLMMHGINVWVREGLVKTSDIDRVFVNKPINSPQIYEQNRSLLHFYIINGSKIAGQDLAIIHRFRSLGNRNPQNMGNDFGHRDVADFERTNLLSPLKEKNQKYHDIKRELWNIRNVVTKVSREFGDRYYFPEATHEYLKAYFEKSTGMSKREFALGLLIDVINPMSIGIDSVVTTDMVNAFRQICREDSELKKKE